MPVKAGTCAGIAMPLAPAVRITTAALSPEEAERLAADLAAVLRPAGRTRAA